MILDPIRIDTARLVLRPRRPDDAAALFALFNNWSVIRWLSSPPWPYTLADAEAFSRGTVSGITEETLVITERGGPDAMIGVVSARMREASHLQAGAGPNLGYWIGEPWWGRGYMTEAVRAVVHYIFKRTASDAIYSGAFCENAASLRVQEKCGFVIDGTTTLASNPRGGDFPHTNTVLTRTQFELMNPAF